MRTKRLSLELERLSSGLSDVTQSHASRVDTFHRLLSIHDKRVKICENTSDTYGSL